MGLRTGLYGINNYHYNFKTVIGNFKYVIQRQWQLLRLQWDGKNSTVEDI